MAVLDFKELMIVGHAKSLDCFVNHFDEFTRQQYRWKRNREYEEDLNNDEQVMFCFTRSEEVGEPAVALWLTRKDAQTLTVSNIVPIEKGKLTYSEYNQAVDDFAEHIIEPHASTYELNIQKTSGLLSLEEQVSTEAYRALLVFSGCANKSTGSAHPLDQSRWFEFLVQIHRDHSTLSAYDLGRWFVEIEHWHEDIAERLIMEYEQARELLRFYDKHGRR